MEIFNLQEAAEQSLKLLKKNGASAKTIKGYRNTGFGVIIRYFTRQGVLDVSAEIVESFLGIYLKEKLKLTKAKVDHVLSREAYKSYKG